jgi:signal transduction histidine kinase
MSLVDLATVAVQQDQDLVAARRRAAQVAELLGFEGQDQTRIATAVSEIARNAQRYGGGGHVTYLLDREAQPQALVIRIVDHGPGIPHLDAVLAGHYVSTSGLGSGILGARRLMDTFFVDTTRGRGTSVLMRKNLPPSAPAVTSDRMALVKRAIADRAPDGLVEEFQRQNQELLRALGDLQARQQELVRLNRELEETNRGVVALYAELDDRADHMRAAAELKSRFHSNMTHEFRTPVVSIIGLCDLLIHRRAQEGIAPESELMYIRQAAEHLSSLVDDLLDLARMEAGKSDVRDGPLDVGELFGTLRGMLKPLLPGKDVSLVFEDASGLPAITTDAGKVSQILRNLISNALKFTDAGEIRVGARLVDAATIEFFVSDTGVGIPAADQERIFEEFLQLEHRVARRQRGTGLGLPLSRRLAELLGGSLTVRSQSGIGSTFTLRLPVERARSTS